MLVRLVSRTATNRAATAALFGRTPVRLTAQPSLRRRALFSTSVIPEKSGTEVSPIGSADVAVPPSAADLSASPLSGVMEELRVSIAPELLDPSLSDLTYGPTDMVVRMLSIMHEQGLPWWASIVAMTVVVRSAMLPLVIMAQKNARNLARAAPEMEKFKTEVYANPPKTMEDRQRNAIKIQSIYKKYDISMKRTFAPLVIQLPLFITFFFGLQKLASDYPSMREGGLLWFTDLSVADPTYALPLLAAGTFLTTIELGGEMPNSNPNMDAKMMKNVMRFMGVAMVPLTMSFPSGVFVYWITTNIFSVGQILTLKQPAVKRAIGLEDVVVPVKSSMPISPISSSSMSDKPKIQDQFLTEMRDARSRRAKRRH